MSTPGKHPDQYPSRDPWGFLRRFTPARIALGSTGVSVPVRESLAFRLAHAHARDAVYTAGNWEFILDRLKQLGIEAIPAASKARDRKEYLQRPDLGRCLSPASAALISEAGFSADIAVIIADGLSAEAVNRHAMPMIELLLPSIEGSGWKQAPTIIVEQGRVAIGDEIGELLRVRLTLMLIGERPGLSSPDSLGVYVTHEPFTGADDSKRNCISNIRPEGLAYKQAAEEVMQVLKNAMAAGISGIGLKQLPKGLI